MWICFDMVMYSTVRMCMFAMCMVSHFLVACLSCMCTMSELS